MPLQDVNNYKVESPERLRVLAVSDVVEPQLYNSSVKEWLGHVDLIVSCGDLPPGFLDFLMTMLDAPLVHVLGNHCYENFDPCEGGCLQGQYLGAFDLNGRVAEHHGLILAGMEGSPLYNNGPHQYTEKQAALNLLRLYPALMREKIRSGRYLDILVTHAPPRGIHDGDDVAHMGFKSLLGFIERFKPTLVLHGHTHRYYPMQPVRTNYKDTEIINVYGHVLLEFDRQSNGAWRLSQESGLRGPSAVL
jgi:Icc-related predicted phosphoesterase